MTPDEAQRLALAVAERVRPGFQARHFSRRYRQKTAALLASVGCTFETPHTERRELIMTALRRRLSLPEDAGPIEIDAAIRGGDNALSDLLQLALIPRPLNKETLDPIMPIDGDPPLIETPPEPVEPPAPRPERKEAPPTVRLIDPLTAATAKPDADGMCPPMPKSEIARLHEGGCLPGARPRGGVWA